MDRAHTRRMHASLLSLAFSSPGVLSRLSPPIPLLSFLRVTGYRLRPPQPVPHVPAVTRASAAVLARGQAEPRQAATLLCELRAGDCPTIVLGGFVPDSTEQAFLLRGMLLRHGSVYYLNYPRRGFSLPMLFAQIDDLVDELALRGQRPVMLSVSFGGGVLVEWLRRRRDSGAPAPVAGAVLVSPVACPEDIVDPSAPRQTTLLGRALKPFGSPGGADLTAIEKARAIFRKMFEAGANNRAALAGLMSRSETRRVRDAVASALGGIDAAGANERVRALAELAHPRDWSPRGAPICNAPVLILFAEREDSVITATSPTRRALEGGHRALFPGSECRVVTGGGNPVQHASLIFHYYQFHPHFTGFYRRLKLSKLVLAA